MTIRTRAYIAILVGTFLFAQVFGVVGAWGGVDGGSVSYSGWAGYLMAMGICLLGYFFAAVLLFAIYFSVNWVMRDKPASQE